MNPTTAKETLPQKVKRLERENRIFRAREQNREEREQGPADAEGIGGRPAVLVIRDKNYPELKRLVDRLPSVPEIPSKSDPNGEPMGFRLAVYYAQTEVGKMVDSVIVSPPVTARMVQDRHRLRMFLHNRAGKMLRGDAVGQATRAAFLDIVERVAYAPSIHLVFDRSNETEVIPTEAPRKGFAGGKG